MARAPKKIRTPLKQQWRQLRYRFLPVVVFLSTVSATTWLWQRHAGPSVAVGEVARQESTVAAGVNADIERFGLDANGNPLNINSMVGQGDVIISFDTLLIESELAVAQARLLKAKEEITAETEKIKYDNRRIIQRQREERQDIIRLRSRFASQKSELEVDINDRWTDIQVDEIENERDKIELEILKRISAASLEIERKELRIKASQKRIDEEKKAHQLAKDQLVKINASIDALKNIIGTEKLNGVVGAEKKELKLIDLLIALKPYHLAVAVDTKQIAELRQEKKLYEIRAPFAGKITRILRWPGEAVERGDIIFEITSTQVEYITAYVRQSPHYRPQVHDVVAVRLRTRPPKVKTGRILQVGAKFEPIPLNQLRNPNIPEWGFPVRIKVPDEFVNKLRPGELVDLTFAGSSSAGADAMTMAGREALQRNLGRASLIGAARVSP